MILLTIGMVFGKKKSGERYTFYFRAVALTAVT